MKQKKENGESIDSKNIRKHKNDIFRLLANVTPSGKIEIPQEIKEDIRKFIQMINGDRPDLKNIGLSRIEFDELIDLIKEIYIS